MPRPASIFNRRSFLKISALAGGGMALSFSWIVSCKPKEEESLVMPKNWFRLNGYIRIGENGSITLMSPNHEGGQNVKTSMPMIIAEELDVDWNKVIVEQAPLDTDNFTRQFIGGSQAIRTGWKALRTAGATARRMLILAAAKTWDIPDSEIKTASGFVLDISGKRKADYGSLAALAATIPIPEDVKLKEVQDFRIIGTSKKNVDLHKIITGKPLFGIDFKKPGMLYAMIIHPPAIGKKLKSFDANRARAMPGIKDVFAIKSLQDDYKRTFFDTVQFTDLIAVVGVSTWQVQQAKKAVTVSWEIQKGFEEKRDMFGRAGVRVVPEGLENSAEQEHKMRHAAMSPQKQRMDGDPIKEFEKATRVIERSFSGPFLAHNCMEPMNFFAHVQGDKVFCAGPLQKPELTEQALADRLGIPIENIEISMTRLGGGYGRRSYAHWLIEAAVISQKTGAPIKLLYNREDEMTAGVYRSRYQATYRAGFNIKNELVAFHVNAGGLPENPLYPNRFPAGAVPNYLAEGWEVASNITTGSFRAPRSNFMACVEQSFLDEIAEVSRQDPIAFRLKLLQRAKENPVGENNDYNPERYAKVLEMVKKKANWGNAPEGVHQGVSAYYCHNSYAAQVVDLKIINGEVHFEKVTNVIDCGIVVNPDAARNLCEGAVIDGIGTAMFGELRIEDGVINKSNFDTYRMIRMKEAPKSIATYFVENGEDPTGLGEPAYPPIFAAVANALYKATGKRFYDQPFINQLNG
ncbi:xanthine dehydrogenase family protein molybdopterin-binding subunit [Cyclobacterium amurskyense]|uniref:xanthine dehydrogenase family protein molybdopterin-binding subunit n=1 Tax=Cyclobacterium amurskyense TaxID=320787 RepID=UPI0030DBE4B7